MTIACTPSPSAPTDNGLAAPPRMEPRESGTGRLIEWWRAWPTRVLRRRGTALMAAVSSRDRGPSRSPSAQMGTISSRRETRIGPPVSRRRPAAARSPACSTSTWSSLPHSAQTGGTWPPAASTVLPGSGKPPAAAQPRFRVWEATRPWQDTGLPHHDSAIFVTFSSDGRHLATTSGNSVSIWDASNGQEVLRLTHPALAWAIQFSPDSRSVLTSSFDGNARIWYVDSG